VRGQAVTQVRAAVGPPVLVAHQLSITAVIRAWGTCHLLARGAAVLDRGAGPPTGLVRTCPLRLGQPAQACRQVRVRAAWSDHCGGPQPLAARTQARGNAEYLDRRSKTATPPTRWSVWGAPKTRSAGAEVHASHRWVGRGDRSRRYGGEPHVPDRPNRVPLRLLLRVDPSEARRRVAAKGQPRSRDGRA